MRNQNIKRDGDQCQPWMSPKLHVIEMRSETRGSLGPNVEAGDGQAS